MRIKSYIGLFAAFCSLLSCSGELPEEETSFVTLHACCAESSKVRLDPTLRTVWSAGDELSVFYGGTSENLKALYVGQDGAAEGDFTFAHSGDILFGDSYALSPYDAGASISGSVLRTSVPVFQQYVEGSYAPGSAVLAARTTSDKLMFSYAVSVIALELSATSGISIGVKSLVLRSASGEPLAGNVAIDLSDASSPDVSVVGSPSDSVVMRPSGSGNLFSVKAGAPKKVYFCVAPGPLSGGYFFDVCLDNGEHRTVRSTSEANLLAGVLYPICAGVTVTKSIIIDFDELSWTPAFPAKATTTSSSGVEHRFTNPSDGLEYSIVAGSETGGYFASGTFLRFNSPGNWMKLPMISGMRLVTFGAQVKQQDSKTFSVSSDKTGSADIVPNTTYPNGQMVYSSVVGNHSEAYLTFPSNNTQLERIELYFE